MFRALLQRTAAQAGMAASQCMVCNAWPARRLCDPCVRRFAQPVPRCRTCALRLPDGAGGDLCGQCLLTPPTLDACHAAVSYGYPWDRVVAQFKFGAEPGLAAALAWLMRSAPWIENALECADIVVPMPLSRERLQERGYNQALVLARALEPGRTDHRLLVRARHGAPSSSLDRAARIAAMQGAFAVDPFRRPLLAGRSVVLVDDVMTTGASLFAAAALLRRAGAGRIAAVVVARTE